jgi:hypothetical protein
MLCCGLVMLCCLALRDLGKARAKWQKKQRPRVVTPAQKALLDSTGRPSSTPLAIRRSQARQAALQGLQRRHPPLWHLDDGKWFEGLGQVGASWAELRAQRLPW